MSQETGMDSPQVELVKVSRVYPPDVVALDGVSLAVAQGEILFLTGASGAGKTTLLKLLCGMEAPTGGLIEVAGKDLSRLRPAGLQRLRQKIGVAYQDFKLLVRQSVFDNIAMAMEVAYVERKEIRLRIDALLEALGIPDKAGRLVGSLSRGEQQRVALARAAANRPELLLADEPTGNLDPAASELVVSFLRRLNREEGTTIIVATHDRSLYAGTGYRVLDLQNGRLSIHPGGGPHQQGLFAAGIYERSPGTALKEGTR